MTGWLAALLWLGGCAPAAADPASIGLLIVGAEVGSQVVVGSITVAQVVGYVALTAATLALSLGANALLTKQTEETREDGQLTIRQPTPSRRRNYGTVKVGGAIIFSEVGLISSIVARVQVVALNQGLIDAFVEHWLDDNHVLLTGGDSGIVAAYTMGTTPYMSMDTRKGLATETAYSVLVTNFPGIWGSSYRGDGIASALITAGQPPNFENFTTVYPGGTAPNYRAVIRAVKVWDPRDGAQDKDNPATWIWSDNPILIALDYHRHADGMAMAVHDATLFTSAAITEHWIPAANICDELVGGIKRYRCGGGYSIPEDAPADVLAAILATCDGLTFQRPDGAIGIRVGKLVAPTITLTDDHIRGYSELQQGQNAFLVCNEVTAKYVSPDHDYQLVDADPWRDEADITARGEVLTKAIALPWVQNHSQARRLMKLAHARANPAWAGTIVTDLAGLVLINERFVHLTISEVGIETPPLIDMDFEIIPDSFQMMMTDEGIRCRVSVSSLDQSAFDWNEGTEAGSPPPVPSDE